MSLMVVEISCEDELGAIIRTIVERNRVKNIVVHILTQGNFSSSREKIFFQVSFYSQLFFNQIHLVVIFYLHFPNFYRNVTETKKYSEKQSV